MTPIAELKNEHRGIETMLRILEAVTTRAVQVQTIDSQDFNAILEFLTVFIDRCHHGKEEHFLFPALEEAGMRQELGPINVLLQEHEQGRQLVAQLREAGQSLFSGEDTAAKKLEKTARDYIDLLTRHIDKEEKVVFQMAEQMLGPDKETELSTAFQQLEEQRIGPGKHEEFHALLHRLKARYIRS